ncbi:hydrogen peroxide-inducible genes activator [Pseudoxanthomonas sp. Root630]|uniref:hydrogen peroxide-inducible genes activator n=1 Tax=Pseudoxanthomonas sp. Root630 TaxID=1736574 RepID=UPI00070377A2|nr:hydrogen peroxide-inducible genes activator [Pseudoxanthomonas sp. Root630]KRA46488.1 LysR family transcriptional regulator [Pseudoxanthomonas sp. Root630]
MNPLPNLRHLRYLVALHDQGNFSRAAESCFVTQSTLSAGIRELEEALGVQVAERTKRSVVITASGRRLVARARLLLRDAEALVAISKDDGGPMSGVLEMGVLPTIGPFLLPQLIRRLGARFPRLRLALREDKTRHLLGQLAEGRLDLVLMAFPYETPGMETFMLFDDAYRYVNASTSAAPGDASCTVAVQADFDTQNLLLLEHDHCLHSHALPALQRAAEIERANFSSTSLHTLVAMVAEGMGATFLPDLAIMGGILQKTNLVVRPLADEANARTIGLCWRRNSSRTDTFLQLGELIRAWASDHIRPWTPPLNADARRKPGRRGH